jgi:glutamate/tyrosine decarboxylase-like PLP-dependent enzyme
MQYLGVDGYRAKQKLVTDAREKIEDGVKKLGFRVLGEPQLGIIAFTHDSVNPMNIYVQMYKRGWFTATLLDPPALHLMLSPKHNEVAHEYLADLETALASASEGAGGKIAGYAS